jgi:hypothetical protein
MRNTSTLHYTAGIVTDDSGIVTTDSGITGNWSQLTGISGHVEPEWLVTIPESLVTLNRNTQK